MTPRDSIFFDEWQACLRAHYIHVIRTNDTVTEPTLRHVLLATGLSEAELAALRAEALGMADAPEAETIDRAPLPDAALDDPALDSDLDEAAYDDTVPAGDTTGEPALEADVFDDGYDPDADDGTSDATGPPPNQLSLF